MKTRIAILFTAGALVWSNLALGGEIQSATAVPALSLSIRCTNDIVKASDEIDIEFRITNRGTNDCKYANRTYDRSGRMNEYQLVATNSSGEAVPDPRANARIWSEGGLYGEATLRPGESFKRVIPLNRWALIKEPGRYVVTGTYLLDSYSTNAKVIVSTPITIDVQARTEREMEAYIAGLSNQIASIPPPYDQGHIDRLPLLDELVMNLMYTCSPRIVPTLLDTMYKPRQGFWESEALRFYVPHSKEVKQTILATAARRGLASGMQSILAEYGCTNRETFRPLIERSLAPDNPNSWIAGAGAAQQYADDSFTPRLIALATETNSPARLQAIFALAANRTDESVKALKSLLDDPDMNIRLQTAAAIRAAYHYRGTWQGRPLKPEDFAEIYHQTQ